MLLWVLVIVGLAMAAAALGLVVAMRQAERRARRSLFRGLGLDDETVELLMARNGDVLAELTLVRLHPPNIESETDGPHGPAETPSRRLQPTTRFLHPLDGGAPSAAAQAASATNAEPRLPASGRRRLPHPGRHGRP